MASSRGTVIFFVPLDSGLQSEDLHPARGIAGSDFRPLPKILDGSLPEESGQYLSPSVADRPLRPATHHGLGGPLPHQLANGTRAPPQATLRPSTIKRCLSMVTFGINSRFQELFPT